MHPCPNAVWQSGIRSCIMPGLPSYLVQELMATLNIVCRGYDWVGWVESNASMGHALYLHPFLSKKRPFSNNTGILCQMYSTF